MGVSVLRLGHRPHRDKRVTTHVALTARAFGADGIFITTKDQSIEDSVGSVVERFGGNFFVETGVGWRKILDSWEGAVVHLTMYGMPLNDALPRIRRDMPVLAVIGAEKVPREIYDRADFNISVGNQPHSEIAALAVFMDKYFDGSELENDFGGAMRVIPSERGKVVEQHAVSPETHKGEIPDRETCLYILNDCGCAQDVIEHSIAVENLAVEMARLAGADIDMVSAGALLHDLGRCRTHGPDHCHMGAKIAESKGVDKQVVEIIRRHIGAGLEEGERINMGLPQGEYVPVSLEQKIVSHADNLISQESCRTVESIVEKFKNHGLDSAAQKILLLHQDMEDLIGVNLEGLCLEVCKGSNTEKKR